MTFLEYYLSELDGDLAVDNAPQNKPSIVKKAARGVGGMVSTAGRKFEAGMLSGLKRSSNVPIRMAASMYPQAKELIKDEISEHRNKKNSQGDEFDGE